MQQVELRLNDIDRFLVIRRVREKGVKRIAKKMEKLGFLDNYPLTVHKDGEGFELLCGNYRYNAAKQLGMETLPCRIFEGLTKDEKYSLARKDNEASESVEPTTFVDDAELIWDLSDQGRTQNQVAGVMGWGRAQVSQYLMLKSICDEAWNIVATSVENAVAGQSEDGVAESATIVAFSENLLRSILPLTPDQQIELVQGLADKIIEKKNKFSNLAAKYKARHDAALYVFERLKRYGNKYLKAALEQIDSGKYDEEWLPQKKKIGKDKTQDCAYTDQLIQTQIDLYEETNRIQLIKGDFYQKVNDIPDKIIDLVIIDPPYNVSTSNIHVYENRKNIKKDFGEWDKVSHDEYLKHLSIWLDAFDRITKDNASFYIFIADTYISFLKQMVLDIGWKYRNTLTWCKSNPGTSPAKKNYISSEEYIAFFQKGEPIFNFTQDNEMMSRFECPIVGGKERVRDKDGEVLHPNQKPQKIICSMVECSSNMGQMVFDGFMGTGTVAKCANKLNRKFIGIEQDERFFNSILL